MDYTPEEGWRIDQTKCANMRKTKKGKKNKTMCWHHKKKKKHTEKSLSVWIKFASLMTQSRKEYTQHFLLLKGVFKIWGQKKNVHPETDR